MVLSLRSYLLSGFNFIIILSMSSTKKHPPHLPRKSSSIKQHETMQTLPWILVFTLFSMCIAAAVSTAFIAWYVPDFVRYQIPTTISNNSNATLSAKIDTLLAKKIAKRQVTLYQIDITNIEISAKNNIGYAIVLSSDGWVAFEGTLPAPARSIRVLDSDGVLSSIETVRVQKETGMTYLKLANISNSMVTALDSWPTNHDMESVWIAQPGDIFESALLSKKVAVQDSELFTLSGVFTSYEVIAPDGSIAYSSAGNFLGFIENNILIPSWIVAADLPAVLSGEEFEINSVVYTGRMLDAYKDPINGVYITQPTIKIIAASKVQTTSTTLNVGDIIIAAAGQPIDTFSFSKYMKKNSVLAVTVLRKDTYIPLVIE